MDIKQHVQNLMDEYQPLAPPLTAPLPHHATPQQVAAFPGACEFIRYVSQGGWRWDWAQPDSDPNTLTLYFLKDGGRMTVTLTSG